MLGIAPSNCRKEMPAVPKKTRKKIRPRSFVLQILYAAPARFYEFLTMQAIRWVRRVRRMKTMNLVIWLPALFVLGLIGLAACLAFAEACARI
jgi:hypothetical protein